MNKYLKISLVLLLFVVLAAIRTFESVLFYDPLIQFYKGDYLLKPAPELNELKLILFTTFRYVLNAAVGLLILWIAFTSKSVIRFSLFTYTLVFLILIIPFIILLYQFNSELYFELFYVRRFLIHPLLIIILLPAFYYQKKMKG